MCIRPGYETGELTKTKIPFSLLKSYLSLIISQNHSHQLITDESQIIHAYHNLFLNEVIELKNIAKIVILI